MLRKMTENGNIVAQWFTKPAGESRGFLVRTTSLDANGEFKPNRRLNSGILYTGRNP
jgi:hypothetical protein